MLRFVKFTGQGGVKRYVAQADLRPVHKERAVARGRTCVANI